MFYCDSTDKFNIRNIGEHAMKKYLLTIAAKFNNNPLRNRNPIKQQNISSEENGNKKTATK